MITIICGVSGSGKTTVGKMLAQRLNCEFLDADDYHPPENISKMEAGEPLNDADRLGWLDTLRSLIDQRLHARADAVLACSALKSAYRTQLRPDNSVRFFLLDADIAIIDSRVNDRKGHFFSPSLLQNQFDTLERGDDVTVIRADRSTGEIVGEILSYLSAME
jgi:gluconokinase